MSNEKIVPSALAITLAEPPGAMFEMMAKGRESIALAAVFAIVVDAGPNGATANEVFAVLSRKSKLHESSAAVQNLLGRLVAEGLVASLDNGGDPHNFYCLSEVGYLRSVRLFPVLFKPASRAKKK